MNNLRFDVNKTYKISNKLLKVECKGNKCYAIKKTDYSVNEKYKLLYNDLINFLKLKNLGEYMYFPPTQFILVIFSLLSTFTCRH